MIYVEHIENWILVLYFKSMIVMDGIKLTLIGFNIKYIYYQNPYFEKNL